MDVLIDARNEIDPGGSDVLAYKHLFYHAQENCDRVKLYAGNLPYEYIKLARQDPDEAVLQAKCRKYILQNETCVATEAHYSIYKTLITARNLQA